MKNRSEIAFSIVLLIAVIWVLSQSTTYYINQLTGWGLPRGWGQRSGLFPTVVGLPLLALSILQLISSFRRTSEAPGAEHEEPSQAGELTGAMRRRTAMIVAAIVGFPIAVWLVGFTISTPLLTFLYLKLAAGESLRTSLTLALVAGLVFYGVFVWALNIPMRDGLLLALLELT